MVGVGLAGDASTNGEEVGEALGVGLSANTAGVATKTTSTAMSQIAQRLSSRLATLHSYSVPKKGQNKSPIN